MKNILITGTSGYVGQELIRKFIQKKEETGEIDQIVALDIKNPSLLVSGVEYYEKDIRDKSIEEIFSHHKINTVIHLACVINPNKFIDKKAMYEINVDGTRNIIECLKKYNVDTFSFASSGAAYGYYEESLDWLTEDRPIRGNEEFPYSFHKRINEEDLSELKKTHPQIRQFIFRIGTVLGKNVNNPITDLFKKPVIMGIKESDAPFVFIWDQDLVNIFIESVFSEKEGIYNVAGDGAVKMSQIAQKLNKTYIPIPAKVVQGALFLLSRFGLSQYGPEQVKFLKYRPVLMNKSLKEDYGYIPQKTSEQVFSYYLENGVI